MNKMLIRILLPILIRLMPRISDELKKVLEATIKSVYVKAKETDSPYDNLVIELVADILGIELDEE